MKSITKRLVWGISLIAMNIIILLHIGCTKAESGPGEDGRQTGYLTGFVKDQAGNPLDGVRILVDHSLFFNANISTYTNAEGKYRVKIPQGSWYAFATIDVPYRGDRFSFYLHPDNAAGFGGEGGVRNFTWKLAGTMQEPLSGTYGGLVTIDHFPGIYIEETEIDFVFTPLGALVDGSEGLVIRRRAEDGHNIKDLPIGRYKLTATYGGKPVKFRQWNTEEAFQLEYDLQFKPQIPAQCDNCAKLQYYWEP